MTAMHSQPGMHCSSYATAPRCTDSLERIRLRVAKMRESSHFLLHCLSKIVCKSGGGEEGRSKILEGLLDPAPFLTTSREKS